MEVMLRRPQVDVAFMPMNLPYTMPPAKAAACVKAFGPKIAIPYHFMGQKPEEFAAALKGEPIEVRILNWYRKPKPPDSRHPTRQTVFLDRLLGAVSHRRYPE